MVDFDARCLFREIYQFVLIEVEVPNLPFAGDNQMFGVSANYSLVRKIVII